MDSEFLYLHGANITKWLNDRGYDLRQRSEFFELFKFNPHVFMHLMKDQQLRNEEKKSYFISKIIDNKDVILTVLANQREGKDSFLCAVLQEIKRREKEKVRIITLGSFKRYPFEDEGEQKYFSLRQIPIEKTRTLYVYVSEMDIFFNNYDWNTPEGKYLNKRVNILAQNNTKIIGAVKLFKNIMMPMRPNINIKCFKYVTKEKLKYENDTALSEEYHIMLPPKTITNKDKELVLINIDNEYFTIRYNHPKWFTDEFSNQYSDIRKEDITNYYDSLIEQGMNEKEAKEEIKKFNF